MKIGFTGAYSVGKTTLADFISEKFGIKKLDEPVRSLIRPPSELTEESLHIAQWLFAKQMMREHIENDEFVCDATIADTLAYSQSVPEYDTLVRQSKACVNAMYDVIFYVPIEFPITDDGFRHTDENYREWIDFQIKVLHKEFGFDVIEITGNLEERKQKVTDVLLNKFPELWKRKS